MRRGWPSAFGQGSTSSAQTGGLTGPGSRCGARTGGKPATRPGRGPWRERGAGWRSSARHLTHPAKPHGFRGPDEACFVGWSPGTPGVVSGDGALAGLLLVDDDRRSGFLAGLDHFPGPRALIPVLAQLGSPLLAAHRVEEVSERRTSPRDQQRSGQAHVFTLSTRTESYLDGIAAARPPRAPQSCVLAGSRVRHPDCRDASPERIETEGVRCQAADAFRVKLDLEPHLFSTWLGFNGRRRILARPAAEAAPADVERDPIPELQPEVVAHQLAVQRRVDAQPVSQSLLAACLVLQEAVDCFSLLGRQADGRGHVWPAPVTRHEPREVQ